MRKMFFLLLLLFISNLETKCQGYKNELGINLFKYSNWNNISTVNYDYRIQYGIMEFDLEKDMDARSYKTYATPHLFYKRSVNSHFGVRGGFQVVKYQTERHTYRQNPNSIVLEIDGYNKETENRYYLELGMQYNFLTDKKVQPYAFALGTSDNIFNKIEKYNLDDSYENGGHYDPNFMIHYSLGAGLLYQFDQRFSTSLELQLPYSYKSYILSRLSVNYQF